MWLAVLAAAFANPYAGSVLDPTPSPVGIVEKQPFIWEVPAFTAGGAVELVLRIPADMAVYRDGIEIEATGPVEAGEPVFPEPKLKADPSDPTQMRALYDADVRIVLPLKGSGVVELSLTHQGCRKGLCWPPTTTTHTVKVLGG